MALFDLAVLRDLSDASRIAHELQRTKFVFVSTR